MKPLKRYQLDPETYNKVVQYFFNNYFITEAEYKTFNHGTINKLDVYLDRKKSRFCSSVMWLQEALEACNIKDVKITHKYDTFHYQVLCELSGNCDSKIKCEYQPQQASKAVHKHLNKYYTDVEIENCLKEFEKDFDVNKAKKQLHINITDTITEDDVIMDREYSAQKIHVYNNCYYYDINGAHCYILSQIFPKAKEYFEYLNKHKHDPGKEHYKAIPNYYVGLLGKADSKHKKTYLKIVNNVTEIVEKAIKECSGRIIYANTDGFIVQNPAKLLEHTLELGGFKLEAQGNVYFYSGINYDLMQYTKANGKIEKKGSLYNSLKKECDLYKGIVVDFDNKKDVNRIPIISNIRKVKKTHEIY